MANAFGDRLRTEVPLRAEQGRWLAAPSPYDVRQAASGDVEVVAAMLMEAADWLERRGMAMWRADELSPKRIVTDVANGLFQLAHVGQQPEPVGTIKFQLTDVEFCPDVADNDAAFERFGFRHHSDRQVGPYFVARYELDVEAQEHRACSSGAGGR